MSDGLKGRVLEIVQYEFNPLTGEDLHFNENNIIAGLDHKTIKQWVYVAHDRDVYSQKDEEQDARKIQGNVKPKHWHVVMRCDRAVDVSQIASWFGVGENYIEIKRGHGAFLDCAFYLTHKDEKQQLQGKAIYEYEEIKCSPGFDLRRELQLRKDGDFHIDGKEFKTKRGYYHYRIMHGMKLSEIEFEDEDCYIENFDEFKHYRDIYLEEKMPMPDVRWNIYIEGDSGVGKDLISRALARLIVDPNSELEESDNMDDNIFFEVGGEKVSFEGYNGQPVIIWTECRSSTLVKKLGGYEHVLEFFDLKPKNVKEHRKYGSITLKNEVNIINSVEHYRDFCNGLVSASEDASQSYRRIPMFLVIHEEDYDMILNKGVFEGTREYDQFLYFRNISLNATKYIKEVKSEHSLDYRVISAKELGVVYSSYLDGKKRISNSENPLSLDELVAKYDLNSELKDRFVEVKNAVDDSISYISLSHILNSCRAQGVKDFPTDADMDKFVPFTFRVTDAHGNVDEEMSKRPFLYMLWDDYQKNGYQTDMLSLVPDDDEEESPF